MSANDEIEDLELTDDVAEDIAGGNKKPAASQTKPAGATKAGPKAGPKAAKPS